MSDSTLTNDQLFMAFQVLEELSGKEAPLKFSYKLAKMMLQMRPEFELLQKTRQDLANKYGIRDEEGNFETTTTARGVVVPKFTDEEVVNKEWTELMILKTGLSIEPLALEEFGENMEVPPVFLEILMKADLLTEE
jgi:hypothetical protein